MTSFSSVSLFTQVPGLCYFTELMICVMGFFNIPALLSLVNLLYIYLDSLVGWIRIGGPHGL